MERWYWIELIAFDNTSKDLGVGDFLARTAHKVTGVSFLFANLEFIIDHKSTEEEYELLPCHCSYGGYLHGDERTRQRWTNLQLRALVRELQKNGVKVAFASFDFYSYKNDAGERVEGGLLAAHRELLYQDKNGVKTHTVCPLKRLNDGRYFEDLLLERLKETVHYYGFDGVQIGDGLSSFRPTIQNGDMSDELVSQFLRDTGRTDEALAPVGKDLAAYRRRRRYIIEHLQLAWLTWCTERFARFYSKFYAAFAGESTKLYFNSVWTRDPFEAYLRYGIDYKTAMHGADAVMVEWATAATINSVKDNGNVFVPKERRVDHLFQFALTEQSIRAALPHVPHYTMSAIKDTFEQWNLMDLVPMEQESAFFLRNHCFSRLNGAYLPTSRGPWYCLSSGVKEAEWQKLDRIEALSRLESVESPLGLQLVFGEDTRAEVARYLDTFAYSRSQLAYELFASGLSLCGVIRAEDAAGIKTPLLVVNPDTMQKEELAAIEQSTAPTVILGTENTVKGATLAWRGQYLSLWTRNTEIPTKLLSALDRHDRPRECRKSPFLPDGGIWTSPLLYRTLPAAFFKALAAALGEALDLPRVVSPRSACGIRAFRVGEHRYRLLLINATHAYYDAEVQLPLAIQKAHVLNKSRNHTLKATGNRLAEKVAPRGTSIIDIEGELL